MVQKRKYDIRSMVRAIERVGASASRVAEEMGCSRSTVYEYARKYPEVAAAWARSGGVDDDGRVQYPREVFELAIPGSHGIKAAVASAVGCSRGTVDNALRRWPDLQEMLDAERSTLVTKAVSALVQDMSLMDDPGVRQRAYMFVLKTLGKSEGFTERQEITGADGEGLFADEARELAESLGLDMSQVVREFLLMMRQRARELEG